MQAPKSANDIMKTKLVTFSPDQQVASAIETLVQREITGGPIMNKDQAYIGIFSEKCCMRLFDRVAQHAAEGKTLPERLPTAKDFMARELLKLTPDADVFDSIDHLLKNHVSGAPVIDADNNFLGVFSEKTSMSVLIQAAYEQLPSTKVSTFMNTDRDRTIAEDATLLDCVRIFLNTPYRRLPVLRDGQLVGQVSRRDVLRASSALTSGGRMVKYFAQAEELADCPDGIACVNKFMDAEAMTIAEDVDLLRIAQIFFDTPYRRLPVLRNDKVIGQVSRRDLLSATHDLMEIASPPPEKALLYLSALVGSSAEVPLK